jgi:PAS domain S-box-containing protein
MGANSSDTTPFHCQETFDEQLALTLESILDGFFACDSEWRLVYLNSTAESVFGNPREELLGKYFWELFPATLGTHYEQELRKAAAGEPRDFENLYEPSGRWYHNRCFPRKGGGISSYFQDITDKKRTEKQLQENEQRLNFYVNHSPLASIEWDSDFIVTRWAGEAEKMFGLTQAETMGKPIMDLHIIYEEDIHLVEGTMAQLVAGQAHYVVSSNRNYTKDGRVIFCEWYNTLVTDPQGRLVSVLSQVMDVTGRRQLEEMLRASEEKYRSLVEVTSDCIWEVDQQGRFTYVSPKIRDMIGYAPEECLGRCPLDFAPEGETADAREQMLVSLSAQKQFFSHEYTVRHRSGQLVIVEVGGVPLFGPDGRFLGMRGITRDITERKRAEEKMRFQSELRQTILDSIPIMVALLDRDGNFQFVNRYWQDKFGWTLEELKTHDDILTQIYPDPAHRKSVTDFICKAAGAETWGDFKARAKDGRFIDTSWTNVMLSDGSTIGIGIDMTERKKAEEKVLQSRRLLNATERISKSGGWEWDLKNGIMMWTDETYRIHGFAPGEIRPGSQEHIERSIACYDPEDRPVIRGAFNRCVEHGEPYNLEFPFTTVDGRRIWIQTTGHAVMDGNRAIRVLGNIFDITERKEAEMALQASLAEKDVLLREVHHRVKNNLASIIGLIEMQMDDAPDTAVKEAFKEIDDRIMSIALVHERLYQSAHMDRIDIHEYLHDLSTHLLGCCGAYSLITCQVDSNHAEIAVDLAIPIGLIVNELVTNAIKYAFPKGQPRGGQKKCEIRISFQKDDDSFYLGVADNGVGLPPDLDWRNTSSLGLSLVSLLGEQQLKGQFRLDLAEGTRFTLTFPCQKNSTA